MFALLKLSSASISVSEDDTETIRERQKSFFSNLAGWEATVLFSLLLSFNVEFFLIRTKFFGFIISIQGASMINSNTTGESIFDAIIGADQGLDTVLRAMLKIATFTFLWHLQQVG